MDKKQRDLITVRYLPADLPNDAPTLFTRFYSSIANSEITYLDAMAMIKYCEDISVGKASVLAALKDAKGWLEKRPGPHGKTIDPSKIDATSLEHLIWEAKGSIR